VTYTNLLNIAVIDLRKFNFTNLVIPICNSLSNRVVSAKSVNTFENRLGKFWSDRKVLMIMKQISIALRITVLYNSYFV